MTRTRNTPIAALLTSVLVLATSSCGSAGSSIVGSTLQNVQSFQAAAGDNQVGTAGSELPTPITVRALTKGGQGVSGISVQWMFSGGGGSLTPGGSVSQSLTTVTNKQGKSSVYWQLDTIAGDQTATATLSGTSSNSTTSVKFHSKGKAGGPARLVVSPGTDTLAVGDSAQFTAAVLDRWKNVIAGATVNWSSSNDSVLTVSSTGMAKALRSGSATVIATTSASSTSAAGSSSISGGASVSVESSTASTTSSPGTVSDLKVSSATDSSVTLQWTQVNDGTGSPAKYALRYGTPTVSWSAAYSTEVSVDGTSIAATESYTFKGLQAGTGYQFQLVSYRGTLNVDAVFGGLSNVVSGSTTGTGTSQNASVTVTPASLSFTSLNSTAQLSAVAKDSTGNTVTNPGFTWKSLATSIATVSATGLVTAKAVGATAIVVTAACCGVDTTPVVVSSPGATHEPSGMTVICDDNGGVRDSNGHAFGCSDFSQWYTDPSAPADQIQVVPDSTNPTGSGSALRFRFTPTYSMKSGDATANTFAGGPYHEIYIRIRFFLESAAPWNGGKLFYLGAAQASRHNSASSPTQFYIDGNPDGGSVPRTRVINQNNSPTAVLMDSHLAPPQGINSAGVWPIGQWITQEIVATAESSPGAGNGSVYVYVDGVLVGYDAAVAWDLPGDTALGFDGMDWYADKNTGTFSTTQYYRLGELYIAGK